MLRTRLWMGAVLIALTVGMLVVDVYLAPWYPFLFLFVVGLGLVGCRELSGLLAPERRPHVALCYLGIVALSLGNWAVHLFMPGASVWGVLAGILTGFLLIVFLYEMARFAEPGRSVERMAITLFIVAYLGWLSNYFAQLRWLVPVGQLSHHDVENSMALALAAFVPKCCDIGAYCTGRLFGRHRMTPMLSPKKTWEGAAGGLTAAVLVTVLLDRVGPAPLLRKSWPLEIAFGLTVGLAGMLGDLAESLLKRDCEKKDASAAVPGFGGVLDVVDAVIFAAPVAYTWLVLTKS
jgi:phosphatidate cytidylyltransferase